MNHRIYSQNTSNLSDVKSIFGSSFVLEVHSTRRIFKEPGCKKSERWGAITGAFADFQVSLEFAQSSVTYIVEATAGCL